MSLSDAEMRYVRAWMKRKEAVKKLLRAILDTDKATARVTSLLRKAAKRP